jgi:hypothetical protein
VVARAYCTGRRLACAALSFELNARGSHRRQFDGDKQPPLFSRSRWRVTGRFFAVCSHLLLSPRRVSRVLGLKCVKSRALKRVDRRSLTSSDPGPGVAAGSSQDALAGRFLIRRWYLGPARKATDGGARYRNREGFLIRWTGFVISSAYVFDVRGRRLLGKK